MGRVLAVLLLPAFALACAAEKTGPVTQLYQGQDEYGAPQKYAVIAGDAVPISEALWIQLSAWTLPQATTLSDQEGCDGVYDQHT